MADDNRPLKPAWPAGRYLRYAIGEIVLVVIGILIALQINNWNENQKKEIKTLNDLHNLKEALIDDIASIELNLTFNKTRLRGIFYILKHSEMNTQTFTTMPWIDISKNEILCFGVLRGMPVFEDQNIEVFVNSYDV